MAGGGIGGAAFALALEQACKISSVLSLPSIKVFERDPSISTQENLGWSFGLKSEDGSGGLQARARFCSALFLALHHEIPKCYQRFSRAHAQYLQNLAVHHAHPLGSSQAQLLFAISAGWQVQFDDVDVCCSDVLVSGIALRHP